MRAFTLIETLILIFIFSIVFLTLFSIFFLSFKVLSLMERKVAALQIARGEIEKIRNLPYLEVGTLNATLPYAKGSLNSSEKKVLNGIEYLIERRVKYVSDPKDDPESCPLDYKKVEISVSFFGIASGKINLTAEVTPSSKSEEIEACSSQPAGILRVKVINEFGEFIEFPKIEILNPETKELIDYFIPDSGKYDFPLSPGSYKVRVSKEGYSKEESFKIGEEYEGKIIALPQKSNPFVLEGEITQITFTIDKLSSLSLKTLYSFSQGIFFDSFSNEEKISEKNNVLVSNGQVTLAKNSQGYFLEGYLISIPISPADLISWQKFSFEGEVPLETEIKYQFLYFNNQEWQLIPDSHLPGNSLGFSEREIDLSHLSTTTYSSLKIRGNLITKSENLTPILESWKISWQSSNPVPIPEVSFDIFGEKIVGKDSQENPIQKIFFGKTTDSQGKVLISNLESDKFYFSNFKKNSENLNLVNCLPQYPVFLAPDSSLEVSLFLEPQYSLLVLVMSEETSTPIFSAAVTLTSSNFSETQYTDNQGKTIFILPEEGFYELKVEAPGFISTSTTVFVSGQSNKELILEPSE